MVADQRIKNEAEHGRFIAEKGEEIWNWSSPAGVLRWHRRVEMFREFLGDGRKEVLEIGCGTGLFTRELCKTGHLITAIDISEDLLELARHRGGCPNVKFVLENAYATRFPTASFDAVVGSSCLHHLEIAPALSEFYRLLKPEGRFMFTEPNMLNPQIAFQKNIPFLKKLSGDSPDETAFIRFFLKKKIKGAGFHDISIIPFDFVHPHIPGSLLRQVEPILNRIEKIPVLREIAGSLVIRAAK
jgi:SAM-dependent methyltransferase